MTERNIRGPRRWLISAIAAMLVILWGSSSRAAVLRWKFTPGEALHYEVEQKTITEAKFNNQDVKTTLTQIIDTTWEVKSVGSDGAADMTQSIDRIRTKIESAFATFEYDSMDGKEPEGPIAAGMVPMLKALLGAKFRYKITPQGELSDVKVPDGLIDKLKQASPGGAGGGMFSEKGLENMITESSLELPKEDLAKGATWTRSSKQPMGPIGMLALDKTYRYEGEESNSDKITVETKGVLEPDPANKLDVKINAQDGKGTFLFDNHAGRVASSSVNQKMDIVIKVMDKEIAQRYDTSTVMKLVDAKGGGAK